jgi:hypothetical protein
MAETVYNHGVSVATTGSGHVARIKPAATDRCLMPDNKTVVFGDNFQPATELGSGQTTKTKIDGHAVWTKAGKLDKSPSQPAHAGSNGGVVDSGAYCKLAWPKEASGDLIIEGNGVVRTGDETHQNDTNCSGSVEVG